MHSLVRARLRFYSFIAGNSFQGLDGPLVLVLL